MDAKRILVVDDQESQMIALALTYEGYDVDVATSGEEALRKVEATSFDLFLLDGAMPRMDGFTLARRLREAGHCEPIIFVTAFMDSLTRPHAEYVGAAGVVEKPFEFDVLLSAIKKALGQGSGENSDAVH